MTLEYTSRDVNVNGDPPTVMRTSAAGATSPTKRRKINEGPDPAPTGWDSHLPDIDAIVTPDSVYDVIAPTGSEPNVIVTGTSTLESPAGEATAAGAVG